MRSILILTNRHNVPILDATWKRNPRGHKSEKDSTLNACSYALAGARPFYEVHTTHTGRPATPEGHTRPIECANGGTIWPVQRTALALIHRGSRYSVGQCIDNVLCDGTTRTGLSDHRARTQSDARSWCNDRVGQTVSPAGIAPACLPQNFPAVVNQAFRDAALAPTYIDALDVLADALLALAALAPQLAVHHVNSDLEGAITKAPPKHRCIFNAKQSLLGDA
ncbi:hypothetical protein QF000_005498 [Paraburkholderia atlantica]